MTFKEIQEISYRIYNRLPQKVKPLIRPVGRVFFSLKRALFLSFQIRLSTYLLKGKEKWGGDNLTTLFFGEGTGLLYLSSLLYPQEPVKESLGKVFIWRIESRMSLDLPPGRRICEGLVYSKGPTNNQKSGCLL